MSHPDKYNIYTIRDSFRLWAFTTFYRSMTGYGNAERFVRAIVLSAQPVPERMFQAWKRARKYLGALNKTQAVAATRLSPADFADRVAEIIKAHTGQTVKRRAWESDRLADDEAADEAEDSG